MYASFTKKLDGHRELLAERENTLGEVRKTLIRSGGNVVGVSVKTESSKGTLEDDLCDEWLMRCLPCVNNAPSFSKKIILGSY